MVLTLTLVLLFNLPRSLPQAAGWVGFLDYRVRFRKASQCSWPVATWLRFLATTLVDACHWLVALTVDQCVDGLG